MRESFWKAWIVAGLSVVFATLIAVPLAYFTVRFEFRGRSSSRAWRAAAHHAAFRRRGRDAAHLRPAADR